MMKLLNSSANHLVVIAHETMSTMLCQIHAVNVFEPQIREAAVYLYCSNDNHICSASSIARFSRFFKLFLHKSTFTLNVLHDYLNQLGMQIVSVAAGVFHIELRIKRIQHFLPGKPPGIRCYGIKLGLTL